MILKNLPHFVTASRLIGIIPYGWILFYGVPPLQILAAVMLIATDKIDGTLARRYGITSQRGALFDTAADTAFILTSWILFYLRGTFSFGLLIGLLFSRVLIFSSRVHESIVKQKWNPTHTLSDKLMGVLNFIGILLILAKFPLGSLTPWFFMIINYGAFLISVKERTL